MEIFHKVLIGLKLGLIKKFFKHIAVIFIDCRK